LAASFLAEREHGEQRSNTLGTFVYPSLADLSAGTPSTFTRHTNAATAASSAQHGSISLGDSWHLLRNLFVQYGMRVDMDRITHAVPYNPNVEATFDRRTDRLPHPMTVSPRAGFQWNYGDNAPSGWPWGTVAFTIGQFRSMLSSGATAQLAANTGLPSADRWLECVGAEVPVPQWRAYAGDLLTIPTVCVNGSGPTTAQSDRPDVWLLDRSYRPPAQWRASANWRNERWIRFNARATYTRGVDQPSMVDLNFAHQAQWTLTDEGGRPVFVPPSAIVPTTGAIALSDSRTHPEYGRVLNRLSDLHSEALSLAISHNFIGAPHSFSVTMGYAYLAARNQLRGFDGTTIGDPLVPTWAPTRLGTRHTIVGDLSLFNHSPVSTTLYVRVTSGMPYTPLVSGDVNGDGQSNDHAFIFDPRRATDTVTAQGIAALLAHAPSGARDCLRHQLGHIATRNSCTGPWSVIADLVFTARNESFHLPTYARISATIHNAIGGLDRLLHGSQHARGWGESAFPDQTLLVVRGFDPVARTFQYQVNPRFGQRNAAARALRTPVTAELQVTVPLGPSYETQYKRIVAKQVQDARGDRDALKRQLRIYNPFVAVMTLADSLGLTEAQSHAVEQAEERWSVAADSVKEALLDYIEALPATFETNDVVQEVERTRGRIMTLMRQEGASVRAALDDEQWAALPRILRIWLAGDAESDMP
jgi:hypothetical protein